MLQLVHYTPSSSLAHKNMNVLKLRNNEGIHSYVPNNLKLGVTFWNSTALPLVQWKIWCAVTYQSGGKHTDLLPTQWITWCYLQALQ